MITVRSLKTPCAPFFLLFLRAVAMLNFRRWSSRYFLSMDKIPLLRRHAGHRDLLVEAADALELVPVFVLQRNSAFASLSVGDAVDLNRLHALDLLLDGKTA